MLKQIREFAMRGNVVDMAVGQAMRDRAAILFDLGGVLVGSEGRRVLRSLLPHLSDEEVLERWHASAAVGRFERGRIAPEAFASEFIAEWGLRLSETQFLDSFAGWVSGFFDGADALLRSLRSRHVVACLSNTNAVHWARMPEAQGLFDFCFASHLTGLMKPDPRTYRHALNELGVEADTVWFLDDLEPNVAAARKLGMRAFRVNGVAEAAAVLRANGLLEDGDAR